MHPLLADALRSHCHHSDPEIGYRLDEARRVLETLPASAGQFAADIISGTTLAQYLGIGEQQLEDFYLCACQLIRQNQFNEALILACFVMAVGPADARVAFKVASCMQRLEHIASAVDFYKLCLQIDRHHIGAAYRLGECFQLLGDHDEAGHLFEWTLTLARGHFGYRKIQAAAESRLNKLTTRP